MGKLNLRGYLTSRFYPTREIRKFDACEKYVFTVILVPPFMQCVSQGPQSIPCGDAAAILAAVGWIHALSLLMVSKMHKKWECSKLRIKI